MPYPALSVANATLDIVWGDKDKITPLKLQKFIYIAHGYNLAIFDAPLILEDVYAWEYGPVIQEIYQEFKNYGKSQITDYATMLYAGDICIVTPPQDDDTLRLLQAAWGAYGRFTAHQLANMTHQPGTPWADTYKDGAGKNKVINNDLIRKYYNKKLTKKLTPKK